MNKLLLILVLVFAFALLWFFSRPAAPKPFAEEYQQALQMHPGSDVAIEAGLQRFSEVYGNLKHEGTAARVEQLYADPMYFNDSLKTFNTRRALVDYMRSTAEMLDGSTVEIEQVLQDGSDVFIRWTMKFNSSAMGRQIESNSIGMSHLRFDDEGRIVLHQDFWDSAAGLYRNLPVVGYALKQVDKSMGQ